MRPSMMGLESFASRLASGEQRTGGIRNTIQTLQQGGTPLEAWLGGMPDAMSGDNLRANQAIGAEVVRARQAEQRKTDPFGWSTLHATPPGLGGTMEPFFNALVGKEAILAGQGKRLNADIRGIGRMKAYDPALSQTYDLESGERPPSKYAPHEMEYISRSQPAMNALRRAVGLPGGLI